MAGDPQPEWLSFPATRARGRSEAPVLAHPSGIPRVNRALLAAGRGQCCAPQAWLPSQKNMPLSQSVPESPVSVPHVNAYFQKVFSEAAELQFDVDAAAGSTNVTRLERMVRDTDAFVGVYPYDGEGVERPTRQQLLEASRYFRLEVDSRGTRTNAVHHLRRPAIRPGDGAARLDVRLSVRPPGGHGPRRLSQPRGLRRTFQRFCENVEARCRRADAAAADRPSVGILLPPAAYDQTVLEDLESRVCAANLEAERLPWPAVLDARMVGRLQAYDWIVADVGAASADTGLVASLHGQCLPTLRLSRQITVHAGGVSARDHTLRRAPGRLSQGRDPLDDDGAAR